MSGPASVPVSSPDFESKFATLLEETETRHQDKARQSQSLIMRGYAVFWRLPARKTAQKKFLLAQWKRKARCEVTAKSFCDAAGYLREQVGIERGTRQVSRKERILITGISCRLPLANNMLDFQDKLLTRTDMVGPQSKRWDSKRLPPRFGFVEDYDKFDAEFFSVVPKLADCMDPQQRKLLEVAFEAVIDSGLNPDDLRGTRTGVYVGALGGETTDYHIMKGVSENYLKFLPMAHPGFMLANRISYALDLKGTSLQVNCGCSASLVALEEAVCAIQRGTCDAAIVAGSSILVSPNLTEAFVAVNALSPDGACKAFDNAANGFVRSEAVIAILVQKESAARRHYATIRHIESNSDGYKAEGIACPSSKGQEALLRSAYKNAGIDPSSVTYIEAHGTGTPVGDPQEVEAIYNVFCRDIQRNSPLIIGSVKTNIGHTEYASGLAGVAKVITCIRSGIIPSNLHFKEHNLAIKHLFGSALEVANGPREYKGGLIAINSFGIGGTNSHLILEPGPVTEPPASTAGDLPVVVPFSGCARQNVHDCIGRAAELGSKHSAVFSLLQNAFRRTIPGHSYRGFGIFLPQSGAGAQAIEVEPLDIQETRPLWYVFPGVGSQWPNMGKDLMKFEAFAESMTGSAKTLKYAGIDLDEILASAKGGRGGSLYTNIRHALVATSAVQIALLDLLSSTGLKADGYLGHSGGEVLCAYADGCLSRGETILVSDAIGRAIVDGVQEEGCMASVGLMLEEAHARCPPEICISYHNAKANVGISGSPADLRKFVERLRAEGVFAQEVNSCGTAVHNRHYGGSAPELVEKYVKEICPQRRLRSSKWISTSVPETDCETNPEAQYCSAAYFASNHLQPVLFHEATKKIPANAVVVEVAPTGHFQGFLKESLPQCFHSALMSSSASDKVLFFLRRIGELHNVGLDVDLGALYPRAVSYPVPANVPYLSPLVSWNHENNWSTSRVTYPKRYGRATLLLDLDDPSLSYLRGHRLGRKIVFPAVGYLTLAWRGLAEDHGHLMEDFPVTFENVFIERATVLRPGGASATELRFSMLDGDGHFVIRDGESAAVVAKGKIKPTPTTHLCSYLTLKETEDVKGENLEFLTKSEAYKELKLRGYNYSGDFLGIERISIDGSKAEVKWTNNWTSFLDTVLQTFVFGIRTRSTVVPTNIERMTINPRELLAFARDGEEKGQSLPVVNHKHLQRITCPGVEFYKLICKVIPWPLPRDSLVYEKYTFSPFFNRMEGGEFLKDIIWKVTELVKDNVSSHNISALEVAPNPEETVAALLFEGLDKTWRKWMPKVTLRTLSSKAERVPEDIKNHLPVQVSTTNIETELLEDACANLTVVPDASWLKRTLETVRDRDFILCRYRQTYKDKEECTSLKLPTLQQLSSFLGCDGQIYELYRKMEHHLNFDVIHIRINSHTFEWVSEIQSAMQQHPEKTACGDRRIYLTSQGDPNCGIVGLVKCLRREDHDDIIRAIFDPEGSLELDFQRPSEFLFKIVANDLVTTVIKGERKGMYYHLPITHSPGSLFKSVTHAHVNQLRTGDLGSLRWFESPYNLHAEAATVEETATTFCDIAYASLNFKDVLFASGKLPVDSSFCAQDCLLGFEFSGEDYYSPGKRVMGFVPSKGLATSVKAINDLLFPVPQSWTLEDAATVPVAYLMAYWALFQHCQISPGQSILVHCGTGGVGQAAISVALAHDCEVFTTVGSAEKRHYIKELFPQLRDDHIGNSRDCSFELQFMEATTGRGVDVVLNSLAGDQLVASVRCLANGGKFLEIGDWCAFVNSAHAGMSPLKYVGFQCASILKVFEDATQTEKQVLKENFLRGLESGVVKPLPRTLFEADQLEEAFRFMARGKHVGKILIDVRTKTKGNSHDGRIITHGDGKRVKALARSYFHPEKTYVVIGGLGGLGLEVANWLVDRGARHIILPSRSGVTSGYQSMCIQRWKAMTVLVDAPKIDLADFKTAERFVRSVESSGRPLGGIFNSTLVLRDKLISEQTVEDFEAVGAPKICITKHMDALTRVHCSYLDYFVTFSSIASGLGMPAQSNYGYANSVMERICEKRAADGLHGLAIQWGAIGDVGYWENHFFQRKKTTKLAEYDKSNGERIWDFRSQNILSCLEVLDNALQQKDAGSIVLSVIMSEKDEEGSGVHGIKKTGLSGLIGVISKIFGVRDIHKLSPATKLSELGMDSLIAAELRQTLERDFDFPLTLKEISSVTIADLKCIEDGSTLNCTKDDFINKKQGQNMDNGKITTPLV